MVSKVVESSDESVTDAMKGVLFTDSRVTMKGHGVATAPTSQMTQANVRGAVINEKESEQDLRRWIEMTGGILPDVSILLLGFVLLTLKRCFFIDLALSCQYLVL